MRSEQTRRATGREVTAQAVRATNLRTQEFQTQLDQFGGNLHQALPAHVSLEKFKRVAITAAAMNPDLLNADRRTLFMSLVKCASDGLLPDGREAALVVYNTEIKMRNPNSGLDERFRIDAVQYMPMIGGIRERMRRSGEVHSATAQVVCRNDGFQYQLGDDEFIKHVPPPLGEERGDIVGAYAIIKLKNGEILRDVMGMKDIERTRSQSRAKDGLMWTKFFDEAAKKTVLRRCAKAAPQASEWERLLERDEEPVQLPEAADLAALPHAEPEPVREAEDEVVQDPGPGPEMVDHTGPTEPPPPAEAEERRSRFIPVPDPPGGQPDYKTWALALFLPQARNTKTTEDMAWLCGDNEANIAAAKRILSVADLREFTDTITAQWDRLEKEPAL